MKPHPTPRRSTAPIALLLIAGVLCLSLTLAWPTSTEVVTGAGYTSSGETIPATVTSTTDPAQTAVAISLLVLAVASFAGAGWLGYRRFRG